MIGIPSKTNIEIIPSKTSIALSLIFAPKLSDFHANLFLDRNLGWNKLKGSVPKALHGREKKGLQLM